MSRLAVTLAAPALAMCLVAAGCNATGNRAAADRPEEAEPQRTAQREAPERARPSNRLREAAEDVERRYVVGPAAARTLGYRIDWQYPDAGRDFRIVDVQYDSVFTLDRENFLTRIDREDGTRIWRVPAAEPIHEILGITYVPQVERVYLTTGGSLLVLDAASGSQVGVQRLEKIANTPPVQAGQFLVYGARNGQLIWHSFPVAFQWRAYQVAARGGGSIRIQPKLVEDLVITIGSDGAITVHNVFNASMLWDRRLVAPVQARPAAGNGALFVAGLDHHLWAYDLYSGRNLWRYLTEHPLTEPPTLIGNHVYQQIPGEGLVCFEATPLDAPGGRVVWKTDRAPGNVIARTGNRVFTWSPRDRMLTIVEANRGGVMDQLHLNQADRIVSPYSDGEELYAVSNDGRITRLLARN